MWRCVEQVSGDMARSTGGSGGLGAKRRVGDSELSGKFRRMMKREIKQMGQKRTHLKSRRGNRAK